MEKNIDHDKEGKLIQMLEKKTIGLKRADYTYRTCYYDIRYVNSYSQKPYVEIIPRYKNGLVSISKDLGFKFSNNSCNEPFFYIDENYCNWEEVLKIQKKIPINKFAKYSLILMSN